MDFFQLRNALARLADIDPAMPLSAARALIWVAMNEGKHQYDMEDALGMSNPSASRAIAWWGEWKSIKLGVRGPGFIENYPDPLDRRYKSVRLTPAGRAFIEMLDKPKE